MSSPTKTFNAQSGLCKLSGNLALDASAPAKVQEAFMIDQLTGGADIEKVAAAKEKLPDCKKPQHITTTRYQGP